MLPYLALMPRDLLGSDPSVLAQLLSSIWPGLGGGRRPGRLARKPLQSAMWSALSGHLRAAARCMAYLESCIGHFSAL